MTRLATVCPNGRQGAAPRGPWFAFGYRGMSRAVSKKTSSLSEFIPTADTGQDMKGQDRSRNIMGRYVGLGLGTASEI